MQELSNIIDGESAAVKRGRFCSKCVQNITQNGLNCRLHYSSISRKSTQIFQNLLSKMISLECQKVIGRAAPPKEQSSPSTRNWLAAGVDMQLLLLQLMLRVMTMTVTCVGIIAFVYTFGGKRSQSCMPFVRLFDQSDHARDFMQVRCSTEWLAAQKHLTLIRVFTMTIGYTWQLTFSYTNGAQYCKSFAVAYLHQPTHTEHAYYVVGLYVNKVTQTVRWRCLLLTRQTETESLWVVSTSRQGMCDGFSTAVDAVRPSLRTISGTERQRHTQEHETMTWHWYEFLDDVCIQWHDTGQISIV